MNINQQNEFGDTALHLAVLNQDIPTINSLISQGANLTIQNFDEDTPLFIAIKVESPEIVLILLKAGSNPRIQGRDSENGILLAITLYVNVPGVKEQMRTIIGYLVQYKDDLDRLNKFGYSALHFGILVNDIKIVASLLKGGANPNIGDLVGNSPLTFSVYVNNIEIAKMLIQAGAKNLQGYFRKTPLDYAIFYGKCDFINLLQNIQIASFPKNPFYPL